MFDGAGMMKAVKAGYNRAGSWPYADHAQPARKLPIGYEVPVLFGGDGDESARAAQAGDNWGQPSVLSTARKDEN